MPYDLTSKDILIRKRKWPE